MGNIPNQAPSMLGSSDPLADLRHDLCTPINQIMGYSELLEEQAAEDQPDYVDDLRKIQKAATTMLASSRAISSRVPINLLQLPRHKRSPLCPSTRPKLCDLAGSWRSTMMI
jgi:K+-sensing histidine kinase KdpD